jgi:hypothetical protein
MIVAQAVIYALEMQRRNRMARPPSTETYSIYGQIEQVVAQAMVEEGKLTKIEAKDVPESQAIHPGTGCAIKFAVIVPREHSAEFERRIKDMYA